MKPLPGSPREVTTSELRRRITTQRYCEISYHDKSTERRARMWLAKQFRKDADMLQERGRVIIGCVFKLRQTGVRTRGNYMTCQGSIA